MTQHAHDVEAAAFEPEVRSYRAGDEAAIFECVRACFGVTPRLESWRHLYQRNPAGEPIILTACAGSAVVAHLALLPRRMRAFGVDGFAGHSIDTLTRPDWQRRGLMTALADESVRRARARGFVVTYGVSNAHSLHTVVKYERRTPLGAFPVLVRPLRPLSAALRFACGLVASRSGGGSDDGIVDCAAVGPLPDVDGRTRFAGLAPDWTAPRFDHRHSALFEAAEGLPPVALVRDAAHLAWRYPDGDDSPYWQRDVVNGDTVAATVVIRTATLARLRLVFVMDWHWRAGAERAARGLLREVVSLARRSGADGVTALAARGTPHRRLLRGRGFVPIPETFFPRTSRLSVRPELHDANVHRWVDPRSWYYTWGDGLLL